MKIIIMCLILFGLLGISGCEINMDEVISDEIKFFGLDKVIIYENATWNESNEEERK